MTEIECITKKWGNSLGIILPKKIVKEERIKVAERIIVALKKRHIAKEFFGLIPEWKRHTDKIKAELKKGWK